MNHPFDNDFNQDVSAVYLYVYSDNISREQAAEIMPVMPSKSLPKKIKVKYVWNWCSKWYYGNDVLPSLENFLFTDIRMLEPALRKLVKEYQARLRLDLVIGVANSPGDGMHNILFLPPKIIKALSEWDFDFRIYEDSQIGGSRSDIDAENAKRLSK